MFTDRPQALIDRLGNYSLWEVALELALIWVVVYVVIRFVQGTRAAGALKGLLLLLVAITIASRVLGGSDAFQRLTYLYDKFIALAAVALIVIFQPELRRALVRLGETPFLRGSPKDVQHVASEIAAACTYLSRSKFGALIVLERNTPLAGVVEGGTVLGAELSARLLQTIFFPGSALHDLAVIVKGRTVHAAGVQLPLAEPEEMRDASLGSRHRAAVGVSKEADALVVVVSEETGSIRIAERGRLAGPFTPAQLRDELTVRLSKTPVLAGPRASEPERGVETPEEASERSV
ncbi:MAG: diadenylate cyclase CdaA [Planctomycetota bacterium]|nr:diadenylate cyclase CdaA [Planctomycetota bacterium]